MRTVVTPPVRVILSAPDVRALEVCARFSMMGRNRPLDPQSCEWMGRPTRSAALSAQPGYHQIKRSRYLDERAISLGPADATAMRRGAASHPLHETVDHLLLAGLFERDGKLVTIDFHNLAVTEFLVKHAIFQFELRGGPGRFGNQLALDRHRAALVARKAAEIAAR